MIQITFLKTMLMWVFSRLQLRMKEEFSENISLEALNYKIRLVVWFFLLGHITAVSFLSETRLPTWFYFFVYAVWCGYFYLLLKGKSELIKGIPFMIVNLGAALALVQKGESYFLRLTTFSLPSLPIYSVQGFPPVLILFLGAGYFWMHKTYLHYIAVFYEPITRTYRIPELSLENTLSGYRIGLFLEIFCLVVYQIVVQRIWKNYQKAKKNLEETNKKLQAVNLQLAKNVEELAILNKQLKNALQSQDLFVACVSHELRNPLNVMLGSLDLLEPHIKGPSEAQLLKTCRVCGDALLSQINNLLDVAKINADKVEINEFATNMGLFLEKFWAFTRIGLEKKRLQGYLSIDKNLSLWLNIDSYRLQQIMNNLVGNAIKFTTEGSVRITFRCVKGKELKSRNPAPSNNNRGRLEVTNKVDDSFIEAYEMMEGERHQTYFSQRSHVKNIPNGFLNFKLNQSVQDTLEDILPSADESTDNFLQIEIVDTGCGINEDAHQSVFEPFVQGDRSVTRRYGGTGLGLYIVKSLVTKMGGNIKVNSLKDVGTRFQIILPVKPVKRVHTSKNIVAHLLPHHPQSLPCLDRPMIGPERSRSETSTDGHPSKSLKRVLIVDDDPFNQTLLKEYFKKFNFECDTANNGLEGFQIYQNNVHKYSFITMDIQMPIVDGITACKRIRAFEKEANIPRISIVIVTGNCSEDERTACLDNDEIQASYFFRKPFRLSDCKLCIERICAENQQPKGSFNESNMMSQMTNNSLHLTKIFQQDWS